MKYENASDVLPEQLLKEVQKYAAGKLLYIPSGEERRAWGEGSGFRKQLQRRNIMIRNKYAHGITVSELADEYYLSIDSIKKIIYARQMNAPLTYLPTIESAVSYANHGMLEEWIHCYLLLTLKIDPSQYTDYLYYGVIKFPLRLIECDDIAAASVAKTKPNDNLKADRLFASVHNEEEIKNGDDPTLLLVHYQEGKFYCKAQTSLLAALKQQKINAYPAIIVLQDNAEYKRFIKYFGTVFMHAQNKY